MLAAFDLAGDWLLITAQWGLLFATRTDGSTWELLPRPMLQRRLFTEADIECIMKTLANRPQLEGDATDRSRPLKRDR